MLIDVQPVSVPLTATPEGSLRVGETRVSLDSVLFHFNEGASAEEIVSAFPTLRLPDVYAVIAYYLHNQSTVDGYLTDRRQHAASLRAQIEADPKAAAFRDRLVG